MAWDADGDPATDNVPVVTLAASETDVVSHDASRATDEPTGRSGPLTAWARRLLERRVGRCQLRWLPRAVPARGP